MAHVKSSALTPDDIEARLAQGPAHFRSPRTRLFLDLYWEVHAAWEARLADHHCVDFEDMLVRAADFLESGEVQPGYDMVLVDEFQDASNARARLARALVKEAGKFLLAVGDDWQSINRFAGADISVMTNFADWFGEGQSLRLQTSFRCPQSVCDVAGAFISKNPRQLTKDMLSAQDGEGLPITVLYAPSVTTIRDTIASYLERLAEQLRLDAALSAKIAHATVNILGRYQFDQQHVPASWPAELEVEFRTVHGSKGLEADYVVIPNMTNGVYGFPSRIADDPVLDIAMAA